MTRERAGGSAGPRILYLSLHATAPGSLTCANPPTSAECRPAESLDLSRR
jgi:hypothetical protein